MNDQAEAYAGRFAAASFALALLLCSVANGNPLRLQLPGDFQLKVVTPDLLELELITTKEPDPARPEWWDFASDKGNLRLPSSKEMVVRTGGKERKIKALGFKRRVLYAPLKKRDLRIVNSLYLQLGERVGEGESVEVLNPMGTLWPTQYHFKVEMSASRLSPAIHVNQVGYLPQGPKQAMAGYFLGSLGELAMPRSGSPFSVINAADGNIAYQGKLKARPDVGFTFRCYQQVVEADFSPLQTPGEYRLQVPELGVSLPFRIHEGVAAALARTHALGLYHQRCGAANELPFTRHTHGPCHTNLAEVPTHAFAASEKFLTQSSADYTNAPRHVARQLKDFTSSLYPYVRTGRLDVAGGHHDAGDYSKYTINSASLVHLLMTAVDCFPGVADIDNFGLPESGDGKSDLLYAAKWEADFLAKLQDTDGGFYFLVYPKDRRYENDVTPDHGDSQIVWPKTTAVTAAAVAALAQCASSVRLKKEHPQAAADYLKRAKHGWEFLERAVQKHGKDGAYQKITHYGDEFLHDDEIAWAACELFLATRDVRYHKALTQWFDPADGSTRRWGWLRLCGSYGSAIRSYALAPAAGKLKREQLDVGFLARCENELVAAARDHVKRARESAYGTSFPVETKRVRSAGWYFSSDAAFDLVAASQLTYPDKADPRAEFLQSIWQNINYELGCNPVNVSYVTGLGWKRQREIVHQYALNDRRILPPSGVPIGNIQSGFMWIDHYKQELGALSFPSDGSPQPYPFYDRWGDSYNLSTEFITLNQARGLSVAAWLMAQTTLKAQPWKPTRTAQIQVQSDRATLKSPVDLSNAQIVWEGEGFEPIISTELPLPRNPAWIEAEALLPDGRRVFAVTDSVTSPAGPAAK